MSHLPHDPLQSPDRSSEQIPANGDQSHSVREGVPSDREIVEEAELSRVMRDAFYRLLNLRSGAAVGARHGDHRG
jgi:hypothetical protein